MVVLNLTIMSGKGFNDIAPPAGCCGSQKPSMPLAFFILESSDATWMTGAAQIGGGGMVNWGTKFNTIQVREHESDRLHMCVVDGAHWRPSDRGQSAQDMSRVPRKHFYGEVNMAVAQFEKMKKEKQWITLKTRTPDNKKGGDSKYMIQVEGWYEDDNIDDDRVGIHAGHYVQADGSTGATPQQLHPAGGPPPGPPQGYQPGPPQGGFQPSPYDQGGYQPGPPQGYPPAQQGFQPSPYAPQGGYQEENV